MIKQNYNFSDVDYASPFPLKYLHQKLKLNLEYLSEDEIQKQLAIRRPGRWGEPLLIDEVYLVDYNNILVICYDDEKHKRIYQGMKSEGDLISLDKTPQIKRFVRLNQILK
jgi:hypothetical protein